ncbi:MAG: hypothetical protein V5A77_04685 [Candidatus Bipolaricaulota bacterium]|nr:CcoQ/FixQ family Cbb3-type cytochrome c oxidase assembly chaperone [Candidatus Bipolaricaulota bacterium]
METTKIIKEIAKSFGLIFFGLILSGIVWWAWRAGLVKNVGQYHTYVVILVGWSIIIFPVGELVGHYLKQREPKEYQSPGLERAGKVIGRLERTIILVFLLGGSLEGIAFLVVAKSIYRFGDLKKGYEKRGSSDEREEATFSISEYIILGSLLSYTVAIIGGIVINLVLSHLGLKPTPLF